MTVRPKPDREGGTTAGPPVSAQRIASAPPSRRVPAMEMRPAGAESAPYFTALVASSWKIRPSATAAWGVTVTSRPGMSSRPVSIWT